MQIALRGRVASQPARDGHGRHGLVRGALAGIAALACALALALGVAPTRAQAVENAVYTATATPYYAHPGTGVIEDSGGEASSALGQSMTESATYPAALVEYDAAGNPFVTLRLMLMDNISDVSISADPDWSGSFYGLGYNVTGSTDTTSDFQVQEDPSSVFRIQMYVAPMGRYVIFYVALSDLVEGNSQGFTQTVDTSGGTEATAEDGTATETTDGGTTAAPAAAAASPAAASPAAASTAAATAKTPAAGGQVVAQATTAGASGPSQNSGNGIQEYDANGNAGGSGTDGTITMPVTGLVVGVVAGIVIGVVAIGLAVALAVWLFTLRHRNAIERANGAAAYAAAPQAAPVAVRAPSAPEIGRAHV